MGEDGLDSEEHWRPMEAPVRMGKRSRGAKARQAQNEPQN